MAKIINKDNFSKMIREREYPYLMLSPYLISENKEIYGKCDDLDYGERVLKILDTLDYVEILESRKADPEWELILGKKLSQPIYRAYQEDGTYSEFLIYER